MSNHNENLREITTVCHHCGALNKNFTNNNEGIGNPLVKCAVCGKDLLLPGVCEWEFLTPAMQVFVFLKPLFIGGLTIIGLLFLSLFVPILEIVDAIVGMVTSFLPRKVQDIGFMLGFLLILLLIFIRKLFPVYKIVRESLQRTQSNRAYRQQLQAFVINKKNKAQFATANLPIYVARNNQQFGQFDENKVSEMLRSGQFLPTDLGIRQGNQHWQQLSVLFPNNFPRFQPILSRGILHPAAAFCIAVGIINLPTMLFTGAYILDSLTKPKEDKKAIVSSSPAPSNSPTPSPMPTFDGNKYKEMLDKKDYLFKLSPPVKLETNPTIKAKVLVIEKLNAEKDAQSDMLSEYLVYKYGVKPEQVAKNLDELQTLVLIKCSEGKEIGQYGPRTAYYSAYAAVCNVSIIDYKNSKTIGKKTFINATRPKTIPDNGFDFINDSPTGEVEKYLNALVKE